MSEIFQPAEGVGVSGEEEEGILYIYIIGEIRIFHHPRFSSQLHQYHDYFF